MHAVIQPPQHIDSMDNNQQNSVTAVLESRMEEADAQAQDPASVITDPALADIHTAP